MAELSWIKDAAKLALEDRKRVKDGDMSAFILPLAAAIAKDGICDFIPIFGGVIGFCITLYLFIFMWGRGKWKVRLVLFLISLIETVPFISILPFQTTAVLYGYHLAKKKAKAAGIELTFLEQATATLRRAEQMAFQHQQVREQEEADETAHNAEYRDNLTPMDSTPGVGAGLKRAVTSQGFSHTLDLLPVVGSAKMIAEAKEGRRLTGEKMTRIERVQQGVKGGTFLAADLTGVGEVARFGKAGMGALRAGERATAHTMARKAATEGGKLAERSQERVEYQRQRATNDGQYGRQPLPRAV